MRLQFSHVDFIFCCKMFMILVKFGNLLLRLYPLSRFRGTMLIFNNLIINDRLPTWHVFILCLILGCKIILFMTSRFFLITIFDIIVYWWKVDRFNATFTWVLYSIIKTQHSLIIFNWFELQFLLLFNIDILTTDPLRLQSHVVFDLLSPIRHSVIL